MARNRFLLWAFPVVLALGFAGYHFWNLCLSGGGTGLELHIVGIEEARGMITDGGRGVVLDIRLHGAPSPLGPVLRVPVMELERRMGELSPYKDAPLFILAATEEEAAATAALLARLDFMQVSFLRLGAAPTAQARVIADEAALD